MPKFHVKRSHCLGNGVDVYEGQVIELDEKQAGYRVAHGWLVPVNESELAAAPAPAVEPSPEPEAVESQPAEPEAEPAGEPGDAPPAPEYGDRQSGSRKSKSR